MKFYPAKWRADPALKNCSLAARGLWIEMLCIMHEAPRRGFLMVKGVVVTDRQLSFQAGAPIREVATLIAELEAAGVFSRDFDGTIYSRRMCDDEEKLEIDRANGKTGGNPRLKVGVNPPLNGAHKAHAAPAGSRPRNQNITSLDSTNPANGHRAKPLGREARAILEAAARRNAAEPPVLSLELAAKVRP